MATPAPKNPWWIPPFFGRIPDGVEPRHVELLGIVVLALLVEEYDLAMLTAALKHIAADLAMSERDFGFYLGLIRLGALPAFLLIPLADRIGRRRVFLVSIAVTGIATAATAFAQTTLQFVIPQFLTRTFFVAGASVAFVMVAEELPAAHRGWGIGMLGALALVGHGIAAGLFASVDRLPFGWRSLYAFGAVGPLLLPLFWRRLPETRRFEQHRAEVLARGGPAPGVFAPLVALGRTHPGRAAAVALVGFLPAVGIIAAFQFTGYFTQELRGWSPAQYSAMVIVGGIIGIGGNIVAGGLGDRIGRRRVGAAMLASFPLFVALFYLGPASLLPFAWVAFLFAAQGGRVTLRTLATEVFPTSHRGAASGLFNLLDVLGAAAGLFALYFTSAAPGELARTTPLLACATLPAAAVLFLLPETSNQELESLSGERAD